MSTIKGIGFDLVDCDRFRAMAQKRPTLIERLFSPEEIAYANKYSDPTVHLCACFAVKEAYLKALGTGINGQVLKQIEMGHEKTGTPFVTICGERVPALVSVSHTDKTAGAVVVLF